MSEDLLPSLKRTLVPIVVGVVGASALGRFVDEVALVELTVGVIAALYYTVLRVVEMRWPQFGVLLGSTRQPWYY